jgi:uncharacterized protein
MTAQEQQLITDLADRIRNAPAPQIDRDAYDLILHTIGTRPDALYILTQTVLIQEMALKQAQAQLEDLKRQTSYQTGPPQQGGFLPGSQQYPPSGYQNSGYQNAGYAAPPPLPSSGGGFSNFLHNAATTAAGVIAGEIAFDSLSSLFGHRGGGFFGGGIMPGSETVVNNYYDDQGGVGNPGGGGDSRFADVAGQDQNISSDIDDERDNSGDSFSGDTGSGDDGGSSDV